jgi:hypothetical protein
MLKHLLPLIPSGLLVRQILPAPDGLVIVAASRGGTAGLTSPHGLQPEADCYDPEASKHVNMQWCLKTPIRLPAQAARAAPRMSCL